jgi:hypothetical protein
MNLETQILKRLSKSGGRVTPQQMLSMLKVSKTELTVALEALIEAKQLDVKTHSHISLGITEAGRGTVEALRQQKLRKEGAFAPNRTRRRRGLLARSYGDVGDLQGPTPTGDAELTSQRIDQK